MAQVSHPELRDWPEAMITVEGNEGEGDLVRGLVDLGGYSDEPGWCEKVWTVEGADIW